VCVCLFCLLRRVQPVVSRVSVSRRRVPLFGAVHTLFVLSEGGLLALELEFGTSKLPTNIQAQVSIQASVRSLMRSPPIPVLQPPNNHHGTHRGDKNQGPLLVPTATSGSHENANAKSAKLCYSKDTNRVQIQQELDGSRRNHSLHSFGGYQSRHGSGSSRTSHQAHEGSQLSSRHMIRLASL
jgi:hypothetical protein